MAQEDPIHVHKYLMEGCTADQASFLSMASRDKSQWAQTGIYLNIRKSLPCCKSDETREHTAPGGCSVCTGGIQNQSSNGPGQPALADTALSNGLLLIVSRCPFQRQQFCN